MGLFIKKKDVTIDTRPYEMPEDFKSKYIYYIDSCLHRPEYDVHKIDRFWIEHDLVDRYGLGKIYVGSYKSVREAEEAIRFEKYIEYKKIARAERQKKWLENNKVNIRID